MNRMSLLKKISVLAAILVCPAVALGDEVASTVDSVASADGTMIYYETAGEGSPVLVFVHCWSCDRSYWNDQIAHFSASHRVVAIDLGGHGQSGLGREDWTMTAYGGDVAAVLSKLDLKQVVLIGHSMGGAVVLEASLQVPDRVRAIIGIDNFQDLTLKYYPAQVEAFLAPFVVNFEATAKTFVASIVGPEADSTVRAFIVEDMASAPPEAAMGSFRSLFGYDFAAALKKLDIPVRTVSSTIRPTNVEKNRTVVPDFQVDFIDNVGHFPMLEKPEMFNRVLARVIGEMTSETETDK